MPTLRSKIIHATTRAIGGIGENFISHQCQRLGYDLDSLTPAQLVELAHEAKVNSLLVVGKVRSDKLERELMAIYRRLKNEG